MPTAAQIARYILERQGAMTAMKLQKLIYYCQAWSLVRDGAVLFDDPIEAWAAGPVVRSLFERHRGKFTVSADDFSGDPAELTTSQEKTIDRVVKFYSKYTAAELSDLTHSERPWIEARDGLDPTERGDSIIDLNVMADFYAALALSKQKK